MDIISVLSQSTVNNRVCLVNWRKKWFGLVYRAKLQEAIFFSFQPKHESISVNRRLASFLLKSNEDFRTEFCHIFCTQESPAVFLREFSFSSKIKCLRLFKSYLLLLSGYFLKKERFITQFGIQTFVFNTKISFTEKFGSLLLNDMVFPR